MSTLTARLLGGHRTVDRAAEPGAPDRDLALDPAHEPRPAADRDDDLEERVYRREHARRQALRRLDLEERGPAPVPEILPLRDWLATPDAPTRWRIEQWQPTESRVMLAAQYKGGKTTLVNNLARSLADGDPLLGCYAVHVPDGRVCMLDTEMSPAQLKRWLREQRIRRQDRVIVVPLRGRLAACDLLDAETRARWAAWLRERDVGYLMLDCLRPVLDALGLDEHRDAGRFLVALDALLREAAIPECLVVHHMGHGAERSRGDSRLRDWPDVEWRLVRQDDDPASPRYISAFGRDVDVAESLLGYDADTRRLTLAGGSRRDAARDAALVDVLAVLDAATGPLTRTAIERACQDAGSKHGRDRIRAAVRAGIEAGQITTEPGARRAILHCRAGESASARQCANSALAQSADRVRECAASLRETRTPRTTAAADETTECADDPEAHHAGNLI